MSFNTHIPPPTRRTGRRRTAWSIIVIPLVACVWFAAPAHGAQFDKNVVVGPGTNPEVTITEDAQADDLLSISFTAQKDWHFTKATQREDMAKLGWKPNGAHTFVVKVRDDLAIKVFHTARFFGEMAPDAKPGTAGSGEAKVYPWDIVGKFKLLYDHEGVGSDFKRTKPGALVSKKPDTPAIPTGVATFNDTTNNFDGTFVENGVGYIGQHTGAPDAHSGTTKSIDLHGKGDDHVTIDCPDGDKAKVVKVYLGVDDAGKIGGLPIPDPDTIEMNTFSAAAELAQANADLTAATAAKTLADAAVTAFKKTDIPNAEAEVAKQKANVETAINKVKAVAAAQKAVTDLETALPKLADAETAAKEHFEAVVKSGASPNNKSYKTAEKAWKDAIAARKKAEAQLVIAKGKLADAKVAAEKDPGVIAARVALKAAETVLQAKQAELAVKETAAKDAAAALTAAAAQVAKYQKQQTDWAFVYQGTLEHEKGHRKILYAHIDKMTTMLNTLRVWGYALNETRAKAIAEIEFKKVRSKHREAIREANRAMQGEGTGYDGITKHGEEQESWKSWPNGGYP